MPTRQNKKAIEVLRAVVDNVNKTYRCSQLSTSITKDLSEKWSVHFIERNKGIFKWSIDGVIMNFASAKYSTMEAIVLTLMEVENCLINYYTFHELETMHSTMLISRICSDIMPELTIKYLEHYAKYLTDMRVVINELELNKCFFTKYKADIFMAKYNKIVSAVTSTEYRRQYEIFIKKGSKINFDEDVWRYFFNNKKSINSYTLDFSKVNSSNIKYELKQYFKSVIKENLNNNERLNEDFRMLVTGFNFMIDNNSKIKFSADISMLDIKNMMRYLSNEYVTQYDKNLSPKTLTIYTAKFRKYYNWLNENAAKIKTKEVRVNHFDRIKWNNVENMIKNTNYIPECVIEKLLAYVDEMNQDFQVMLLVMLNGGLHFKDVALLDENCIEEDINGEWVLKYIPYKIYKKRINNGLSKYHKIIIHESVANEIINQINRTKELRQESGFKEIFIHKFNNIYIKVYDTKSFNRAINEIIVKHYITDEEGKLWRFTSKQCRKTLAVDMIMNGAQSNEVANYLAHNQMSTTNKYYAEVRKLKLAEMNDEFWSKEFNSIVPKEQLNQFTEDERKVLYAEFKLGMREVELGYCMKGFWEEPCSKISGKISCATCEKICIGIQKHNKWKLLKDSQEKVIEELVKGYKKLGIQDYKEYREYQREIHLLKAYEDALNKIISFSGDGSV